MLVEVDEQTDVASYKIEVLRSKDCILKLASLIFHFPKATFSILTSITVSFSTLHIKASSFILLSNSVFKSCIAEKHISIVAIATRKPKLPIDQRKRAMFPCFQHQTSMVHNSFQAGQQETPFSESLKSF